MIENTLQSLKPILTLDLFPAERAELLSLLRALTDDKWSKSTVCPGWSVKDIGLHLLGDEMSILSKSRDGFQYGSVSGDSGDFWKDLVVWLNQWNQQWVETIRRISPELLCQLLEFTGNEVYRYFSTLELYELGSAVSWAGPDPAPIWLDIAREYTERWVHHQQIRDALNRPGMKDPRFFSPVLDTFVRALPHTFRGVDASEGTSVTLSIAGNAGGTWTLVRELRVWVLYKGSTSKPSATVQFDQETAWRLFTKAMSKDETRANAIVEGDRTLALRVFDVVSIIA